jgi:hypothetical protein
MPSTANKDKYGEIGSPLRIPLDGTKESSQSPLNKTEKHTMVTNLIIMSTHKW